MIAAAPTTQVLVLQTAALVVAGALLAFALAAAVFSLVETFRRAAVLPLAIRFASSRWINVVSVAGVALGVAALIVVLSVMNGFISEHRRLIRGSLADLTIQPRARQVSGMASRMPGSFEEYRRALDGCPHVRAIAPRFVWAGLAFPTQVLDVFNLARSGSEFVVEMIGVDADAERGTSNFEKWIGPFDEGDLSARDEDRRIFQPVRDRSAPFRTTEHPDELPKEGMIVGISLAKSLRLRRGDRIEVVSIGIDATRESPTTPNMFFEVSGMFHTEEQNFDSQKVLVRIPALQKFLAARDIDFTEIVVKLDDYRNASAARDEIGRRLLAAGLLRGGDVLREDVSAEVRTWEEQRKVLLAAIDNERGILGVILFFIVVVATFILFATLSMLVNEKTRDIGILSTLGASWGEILAVFVDVGAAMTAAGSLLGLGVGLLVAQTRVLNAIERFLGDWFGLKLFNPEVYYLKSLPSEIHMEQVAVILGATLVAGILFSVVPAVRAARLDPARALRYE